ncbi:hypothetical protein [Streptomyces sp. NBC_00280]|uniref:hypothetical protein n=1 Tax=Streptomyces sp. NBC_00280 TaxID=2975699 RepID=UPI00324A1FD1
MSVSRRAGVGVLGVGQVLTGARTARTGPDDIVFCDSVGLGVQDAAWAVVHAGRREGR